MTEPPRPDEDDQAAIVWWNSFTGAEKAHWLRKTGNPDATITDAWETVRQVGAAITKTRDVTVT